MSRYRIRIDGDTYELEIEILDADVPADEKPALAGKRRNAVKSRGANAKNSNAVFSPMPGTVSVVNFSVGDRVNKGDIVLVIESMKMENEIQAPADGVITLIDTAKGQNVAAGDLLFEVGG